MTNVNRQILDSEDINEAEYNRISSKMQQDIVEIFDGCSSYEDVKRTKDSQEIQSNVATQETKQEHDVKYNDENIAGREGEPYVEVIDLDSYTASNDDLADSATESIKEIPVRATIKKETPESGLEILENIWSQFVTNVAVTQSSTQIKKPVTNNVKQETLQNADLKCELESENNLVASKSKAKKKKGRRFKIRLQNGKPNFCMICYKVFQCPLQLEEHLSIHSVFTVYSCKHCGQEFPNENENKRHERTHEYTGEEEPDKSDEHATECCNDCNSKHSTDFQDKQNGMAAADSTRILDTKSSKEDIVVHGKIRESHDDGLDSDCNITLDSEVRNPVTKSQLSREIHEHATNNTSHESRQVLLDTTEAKEETALRRSFRKRKPVINQLNQVTLDDVDLWNKRYLKTGKSKGKQKKQDSNVDLAEPCIICHKVFKCPSKLQEHLKVHSVFTVHKCKICGQEFSNDNDCKRHETKHLKTHDSGARYECRYCTECYETAELLRRHEKTHNGEKRFARKSSSKTMKSTGNFRKHENIHSGIKQFSCKFCKKSFAKKQYLRNHEQTHTGEKNFQCAFCDKRFIQRGARDRHEITHTDAKPYKCKFCQKAFNSQGNCYVHERKHSGAKIYQCKFCNKEFNDSSAFRRHERIHTGDKRYKCEECEKQFSDAGAFSRHKRTHSGEKPFKCSFCDMRFACHGNRTSHERTHTGEKPYKCSFCEKRFSAKGNCNMHEQIHRGVRLFNCRFCEKTFVLAQYLKIHERTHNKNIMYLCTICDEQFSNQAMLWKHMALHKNEQSF